MGPDQTPTPSPAPAAEPAPALPDTALTGPAAEPAADNAEPAADSQGDAPAKLPDTALTGEEPNLKPDTPEGYDLAFAEGTQVDEALLGQFQKTAHELGLSKDQAQKVADLYAGHVEDMAKQYQAAQFKALNDYINTQNAELAARPTFKEDMILARKTLKEFGSEELVKVLAQTAMGSHPAMFDFVVKIGKALGEPSFKGDAGRAPASPLHTRIWGEDGRGPAPQK